MPPGLCVPSNEQIVSKRVLASAYGQHRQMENRMNNNKKKWHQLTDLRFSQVLIDILGLLHSYVVLGLAHLPLQAP